MHMGIDLGNPSKIRFCHGSVIQENLKIERNMEAVVCFNPVFENCDDLLYVADAGVTLPDPTYAVSREEEHNHWRDQYVFEYVLSGRGYIECGGQSWQVEGGDTYFLNRLHSHRYWSDAKEPFSKLWINVSGRLLNHLVELYGISEGVVVRRINTEQLFTEIHAALMAITPKNKEETCREISVRLHWLLASLAHSDSREADIHDRANRAQQIKRFIDGRNNFDLTLDDIAAHFYLNKIYLTRVFRAAYGITPKQYMLHRRIEAAQNMLSNSNTSIQDIATLLHFASAPHLSSAFHREVGMSPGEYRKKYQ